MTLTQHYLTFDQFLAQYASDGCYELVNGELHMMQPTRKHDTIADFIGRKLDQEVERLQLPWVVTSRIFIRTLNKKGREHGRHPDVSVISRARWEADLTSYAAFREPLQVAIEVTSTNWEDDYIDKREEYAQLGIVEYWIVDYQAIASRTYLGDPKVPTISIYQLDREGNYQAALFQGEQQIISPTFPELSLTAQQIFNARSAS